MKSDRLDWITVAGLGHLRPAPGTWGSLPTVIIAAVMIFLGYGPAYHHGYEYNAALIAICAFFTLGCVVQGGRAEKKFGRKDPSQAVADETAGQAIPLMFIKASAVATTHTMGGTLILAFLAFRLFDILKITPAREIQRLPGGWGIVLDDLIAGVQAAIVVQICTRLFT